MAGNDLKTDEMEALVNRTKTFTPVSRLAHVEVGEMFRLLESYGINLKPGVPVTAMAAEEEPEEEPAES